MKGQIGVPFKPLPVGILGDVSRGVLSARDFSVYCWLLANSHWEDYGLRTNAVRLGEALSQNAQAVKRALRRLERAGWIRRSRSPGQRGGYLIWVLVDPRDLQRPCQGAARTAERGGERGADGHREPEDEPVPPDVEPGAPDSDRAPHHERGGERGADGPSYIEIEKEKGGGGGEDTSPSSFDTPTPRMREDMTAPQRLRPCTRGAGRSDCVSLSCEAADGSGQEGPGLPASLTGTPPPDDDTDSGKNMLRGVLRHWRKVFPLAGNISDEMAQKVFEEAHALGIPWVRMRTLMEQHLRLTGDRGAVPWRILREEVSEARRRHGRAEECRQCREGIIEVTVTDPDGELDVIRVRCSCRVAEIRATQGARPLASLPRLDDLIPPQKRKEMGIFADGGRLKRLRSPAQSAADEQVGTTPTIMVGTSRLTWFESGG